MDFFDPSFVGLTGSDDELLAAATPFGVYFEKQEGTEATGYLVDHTASVALVDREGHLRLFYPFDTTAEEIASDLDYFVK
jgi:protein SCO1/2